MVAVHVLGSCQLAMTAPVELSSSIFGVRLPKCASSNFTALTVKDTVPGSLVNDHTSTSDMGVMIPVALALLPAMVTPVAEFMVPPASSARAPSVVVMTLRSLWYEVEPTELWPYHHIPRLAE